MRPLLIVVVAAPIPAASTAAWLRDRPNIALIARDRDGLYADASRQGAPQARQIADRFHLIQNLRVAIERQLSGLERPVRGYRANPGRLASVDEPLRSDEAGPKELTHISGRPFLLGASAKVRAIYEAGEIVAAITRKLRLSRKTVNKWVRLDALRGTRPNCTQALHAGSICQLPAEALGRGGEERSPLAAGDPQSGLYWMFFPVGGICREVAAEIGGEPGTSAPERSAAARRPDRGGDLARGHCSALYQTALFADHASSGKGRCTQAGSADVRSHAILGDAVPWANARRTLFRAA